MFEISLSNGTPIKPKPKQSGSYNKQAELIRKQEIINETGLIKQKLRENINVRLQQKDILNIISLVIEPVQKLKQSACRKFFRFKTNTQQ